MVDSKIRFLKQFINLSSAREERDLEARPVFILEILNEDICFDDTHRCIGAAISERRSAEGKGVEDDPCSSHPEVLNERCLEISPDVLKELDVLPARVDSQSRLLAAKGQHIHTMAEGRLINSSRSPLRGKNRKSRGNIYLATI